MKTALILGGTGAMGRYLVELLSQRHDWSVSVTSRNDRKNIGNIKFIKGNARDRAFMSSFLTGRHFDVIVDFMNYGYDEFMECHKKLLSVADHYVFLSSSRVYAFSETPIIEKSPRLLDVTTDQDFLQTQRYALRKARQENILKESGFTNYTIIRPYITYSDRRLQLGVYEKEQWLYRVLNDKPIVIREEILSKRTTLTYGKDVSYVLSRVMDSKPLAESVHIMTEETMTWGKVLSIYREVIKKELDKDIKVFTTRAMSEIEDLFEGGYNTKYDRLYDRSFDNALAELRYGHVEYLSMEQGLRSCLKQFIVDWRYYGNSLFLDLMWDYEALMDWMLAIERPMPEMDEEGQNTYRLTLDKALNNHKRFELSEWTAI